MPANVSRTRKRRPVRVTFDPNVALHQGPQVARTAALEEGGSLLALVASVVSHVVALDRKLETHLRPRPDRDTCPLCGGTVMESAPTTLLSWRRCVTCGRHQEGRAA